MAIVIWSVGLSAVMMSIGVMIGMWLQEPVEWDDARGDVEAMEAHRRAMAELRGEGS